MISAKAFMNIIRLSRALLAMCLLLLSCPLLAQEPVLTQPEFQGELELVYPEVAVEDQIVDQVIAIVFIAATGEVVKVEIAQGPDNPGIGFEEAAIEALTSTTFLPATRDGQPIPVKIQFQVDFFPPPLPIPPAYLSDIYLRAREAWAVANPPEPPPPPEVRLAGQVLERGTRVELAGVLVSATRDEENIEEYTDAEGEFQMRGLAPGEWTITIAEAAFGEYTTTEEIVEGERVDVTYYVERLNYDAYGVDSDYVYETRGGRLRKEVSRTTVEVSEIQKIPGNQGDALRVVQNLPGVARSPAAGPATGAIVVRGSAPQDTQVLLDGSPIPLLYHFGGLTSVVNSDVLARIDFIPGNFSVRFGRALGGILDVQTRPPRRDRYSGYIDIDIIDASILLEGPIPGRDDMSFQISARRSYLDSFIGLVIPEDIGLGFTTAPRYWDYQARFNWQINGQHSIEAFAYGSDDVLEILFDEPNAQNPSIRGSLSTNTFFHKGQLTWKYESDFIENRLVYNIGGQGIGFSVGDLLFDLDTFNNTLREELTIRPTSWLSILVGLDMLFGDFDIALRLPKPRREGEPFGGIGTQEFIDLGVSGGIYDPAAFLEVELKPLEELLVTVGGRVDYTRFGEDFAGDIRGSARYDVLPYLTVKGGVGTFHQAPQPQETADGIGNPNLEYNRAIHYAVGFESRLADIPGLAESDVAFFDAIEIELTGFYKTLDNLVAPSTRNVERDGQVVPENFANTGEGEVIGLEFLLRHQLANNFFGWIAYTVSQATRRDFSNDETRLFNFDQTHILTIIGSYKLPDHWQVGLRFRFATGAPFTPNVDSVYDADADQYDPIAGPISSRRIEDFHQLDIRVDKSFIFDTWILSLYLDIQNVYFRSNAEFVQYNFDSTQLDFVRGLPILPSFGIKGEF